MLIRLRHPLRVNAVVSPGHFRFKEKTFCPAWITRCISPKQSTEAQLLVVLPRMLPSTLKTGTTEDPNCDKLGMGPFTSGTNGTGYKCASVGRIIVSASIQITVLCSSTYQRHPCVQVPTRATALPALVPVLSVHLRW